MADPHAVFNEMVSTTLRNHPAMVEDNLTLHHPLYDKLKARGNLRIISGGTEIARPVRYPGVSTYQRYAAYQRLVVKPPKYITAVNFQWKQCAFFITAAGSEIRANSSKEAIVNLVKERVQGGLDDFANNHSLDIHSDGTADEGKQIGGLQQILTNNGQGTVGGIDAGTHTWWQNSFQQDATMDSTTIKGSMHQGWLDTVRGQDKIDLWALARTPYSAYWDSLTDLQRYTAPNTGKAGFDMLKHNTADVFYEANEGGIPDDTGYGLNTKYIELVVHGAANVRPLKTREPVDQDAEVHPYIWQGNLIVTNRKRQVKLFK